MNIKQSRSRVEPELECFTSYTITRYKCALTDLDLRGQSQLIDTIKLGDRCYGVGRYPCLVCKGVVLSN